MISFKKWFVINEGKEERALALELAGDGSVLSSLSEVIPQGAKETDSLLLLAAYYYSKNKNLEQIKIDMRDYIGFLKNNRMPLIKVDVISKEPVNPWNNYMHWTEVIHGHQGEDAAKSKASYKASEMDFQGEVPIMTNPDGKIKVYKAHSPQQCIILGKGQTFCISKPGNTMWQSYRDQQVSTFYFVYDHTRDDRLSIVVVDVTNRGVILTDKNNTTGTTLDPHTNKLTSDSDLYMRYLSDNGIDVSKLVNMPKTDKEIKEERNLGKQNQQLNWFKSLSHGDKSKYIGRGHQLSDEQFDYLWENKFVSLLTQYVKTGLRLSDHQVDKIASNRDLRDNYLHNRLIANVNTKDLTKKEFSLLKPEQKKKILSSLYGAIKFAELEDVKNAIKEGAEIDIDSICKASAAGRLDIIKYIIEEENVNPKSSIFAHAMSSAAEGGHFDLLKYLVEKRAKIGDNAVYNAASNGHLDIVKYLVEKRAKIGDNAVYVAAGGGYLDIVKYLVEKGATIRDDAVYIAASDDHLDIVKYLVEKGAKIGNLAVAQAAYNGHLAVVKYLVEKGATIRDNAVYYAACYGHLDIVKYLVEKGATIRNYAVADAATNGHLDIVKYLVGDEVELNGEKIRSPQKGAEIGDDAVSSAAKNGHFEIVKYLVKKGARIGNAVEDAATNGHLDIAEYLEVELNKR